MLIFFVTIEIQVQMIYQEVHQTCYYLCSGLSNSKIISMDAIIIQQL